MGCIFCKIAAGEIPSNKVYENDQVLAFDDVQPLAPVHTIVIPKKHYGTVNDLDDREIWFAMLAAAQEAARIKGIDQTGYRLVINCGEHGTQVVKHLHLHVLGGRQLESSMG
jgi:histidine triad (HIT) family protein